MTAKRRSGIQKAITELSKVRTLVKAINKKYPMKELDKALKESEDMMKQLKSAKVIMAIIDNMSKEEIAAAVKELDEKEGKVAKTSTIRIEMEEDGEEVAGYDENGNPDSTPEMTDRELLQEAVSETLNGIHTLEDAKALVAQLQAEGKNTELAVAIMEMLRLQAEAEKSAN